MWGAEWVWLNMGRLNWTEQFLTKNQNLMGSERGASRRISAKAVNDATFPQWLIWFSNEEHHRWSGEETHRPLRCHGCITMNPSLYTLRYSTRLHRSGHIDLYTAVSKDEIMEYSQDGFVSKAMALCQVVQVYMQRWKWEQNEVVIMIYIYHHQFTFTFTYVLLAPTILNYSTQARQDTQEETLN